MALRYRPNQAQLNQMLHGRRGPVVLHVANVGRQVEGVARRKVGVDTGRLRRSIGSRVVRSNPGYNSEVFADTDYAIYHHDGTRPHIIRPRRKQALKFEVGGRTVFAKQVHHPGTRPNRFLLEAAQQVGLKVRRR